MTGRGSCSSVGRGDDDCSLISERGMDLGRN